jgi:hypothetical protein
MSRSIEQQLQLIKLLAKKMDISTENDFDEVHSDLSEDEAPMEDSNLDLSRLSKNR